MPDSLTALAIVALVGVPGFVYLALVGRARSAGTDDGSYSNLETTFFGLACGLTGGMLSLIFQTDQWIDLIVAQPVDEDRAAAAELLHDVTAVGIAAFLNTLLAALFFAGIVRVLKADSWKKRGREAGLLVLSAVGVAAVALVM